MAAVWAVGTCVAGLSPHAALNLLARLPDGIPAEVSSQRDLALCVPGKQMDGAGLSMAKDGVRVAQDLPDGILLFPALVLWKGRLFAFAGCADLISWRTGTLQ